LAERRYLPCDLRAVVQLQQHEFVVVPVDHVIRLRIIGDIVFLVIFLFNILLLVVIILLLFNILFQFQLPEFKLVFVRLG
jgi:hypothetical protein